MASSVRKAPPGATITPEAPSSITARASSRIAAKPGLETPTTTGTRPATRLTTCFENATDSATDSFGASPIMPRMVSPVAPRDR